MSRGVSTTPETPKPVYDHIVGTNNRSGPALPVISSDGMWWLRHHTIASEELTSFSSDSPWEKQEGWVGEVPRERSPAHPGTETILLVEDNEELGIYLQDVLTSAGYSVFVASHAVQALFMAYGSQASFDLLLTDVVMPRISGPELVNRLKKRYPVLKVLYMSGVVDQTVLASVSEDQCGGFLPKPFPPSALLQKIRDLLDAVEAT